MNASLALTASPQASLLLAEGWRVERTATPPSDQQMVDSEHLDRVSGVHWTQAPGAPGAHSCSRLGHTHFFGSSSYHSLLELPGVPFQKKNLDLNSHFRFISAT